MISTYLTDTVNILYLTYDSFGVQTETPNNNINARVKYITKTIMDINKKEVEAKAEIMLTSDTIIKNGDKIQVTKINGEDAPELDKKYQFVMKGSGHGFSPGQSFIQGWLI